MGLEKIKEYKRRLGMTTAALAEKSGIPKGTLDEVNQTFVRNRLAED